MADCRACSLSCEPLECEHNATHPLPWRACLGSLVASWLDQHRGRHELDAADFLAYVKQRVVEDEAGRKTLAGRFSYSQEFAQIDPWAERAKGADKHEFIPLKLVS